METIHTLFSAGYSWIVVPLLVFLYALLSLRFILHSFTTEGSPIRDWWGKNRGKWRRITKAALIVTAIFIQSLAYSMVYAEETCDRIPHVMDRETEVGIAVVILIAAAVAVYFCREWRNRGKS